MAWQFKKFKVLGVQTRGTESGSPFPCVKLGMGPCSHVILIQIEIEGFWELVGYLL